MFNHDLEKYSGTFVEHHRIAMQHIEAMESELAGINPAALKFAYMSQAIQLAIKCFNGDLATARSCSVMSFDEMFALENQAIIGRN